MKYLSPISGFEWTFEDHARIFNDNIQGANCYSYALNHPEPNGKRPQKSVPGDITKKSYPFTDWQSCGEAIRRIVDDGKTVGKMYRLPTVIHKIPGNLKKQMALKPPPEFRKFVLVVETNEEKNGVPTDFHFYAQNKIIVDQIYNMKLSGTGKSKMKNPYIQLNVNAFCSKEHLKRSLRNNNEPKNDLVYKALMNNRGLVNVMLHESIIPNYALDFIVDPWWLLDLQIHERNKAAINKKIASITKQLKSTNIEDKRKKRCMKILQHAKNQCLGLLNGSRKLMSKGRVIGIWSHKLGWGTKPLNTDGNMKILFNPALACRNHGGYDYDLTCQAFLLRTGYGHSSA